MRGRKRRVTLIALGPILLFALLAGAHVYRTGRRVLGNLQSLVVPELQKQLGREVRIGSLRLAGAGSLVAEDIAIADGPTFQSGTFLQARRAVFGFGLWRLLTHRSDPLSALGGIRIEDPELLLVRSASGKWNASQLGGKKSGGTSGTFRGKVTVSGARITVRDHYFGPRSGIRPGPAVVQLRDIKAVVDASRPSTYTITVEAKGNSPAPRRLAVKGDYRTGAGLNLEARFDGAGVAFWQSYFHIVTGGLPVRSGEAGGQVRVVVKPGQAVRVEGLVRAERLVVVPPVMQQPLVLEGLTVGIAVPRLTLNGRVHAGAVPATLSGTVTLGRAGGLDLHVDAPVVTIAQVRPALRGFPQMPDVAWDTPVAIKTHILGPLRAWRMEMDAQVPRVRAKGVAFTDLRVTAAYQPSLRRVAVRSIQAAAAGGRVTASGYVDLRTKPIEMAFIGTADSVVLAASPLLPAVQKQGTFTVRFEAQGPSHAVRTKATLSGTQVTLGPVSALRVDGSVLVPAGGGAPVLKLRAEGIRASGKPLPVALPERANATLELLHGRVRVRAANLSLSGTPVSLSGSVGMKGELDLRVAADGFPAGALEQSLGIKGVRGSATVRAQVTGTAAQPRVAGSLSVPRGRVQKVAFRGLNAKFDVHGARSGVVQFTVDSVGADAFTMSRTAGRAELRGDEILLPDLHASLPKGRLTARGKVSRSGVLDVALSGVGMDVAALARAGGLSQGKNAIAVSGLASFDGHLGGSAAAPLLEGRVSVVRAAVRGLKLAEVQARIRAGREGIALHDVAVRAPGQTLTLAGTVEARRGGPVRVDAQVRAEAVDLAPLLKALNLAAGVGGRARADLRVAGAVPDLSVTGDFAIDGASYGGATFERVSGRLTRSGSETRVENLTLADGPARLVASGTLGAGGRVALTIEGKQIPLEQVQRFTAPYARMAGRADVSGTVAGTLKEPQVRLSIRATAVALNGQAFDTVSGDVAYAHAEVRASDLALTHGKSAFRVAQLVFRPKQGSISLDASAQDADLESLAALVRSVKLPDTPQNQGANTWIASLPAPLRGHFTGTVSVNGRLPRPAGSAEFSLTDATVGEAHLQRFAGKASWTATSVQVQQAVLVAEGIDLTADLTHGPGDFLETRVELRPSRLEAVKALARSLHLVPADTAARVAAVAPSDQGRTPRAAGLRTEPAAGQPAHDAAGLRTEPQAGGQPAHDAAGLRTEPAAGGHGLEHGPNKGIAIAVIEGPPAPVQSGWQAVLGQLPEPFVGEVSGSVSLSGRMAALNGTANLSLRGAELGEARVAQASVTARWDDGSVVVDNLALRSPGVDVKGSFTRKADQAIDLNLHVTDTDLAAARGLVQTVTALARVPSLNDVLAGLPDPLAGRVNGTLSLAGRPGALHGTFNAQGTDLRLGESQIPSLVASGGWSGQTWSFEKLDLVGKGFSLSGSLVMGPGERVAARLETKDAQLAEIRKFLAGATFLNRFPAAKTLVERARSLPANLPGVVTANLDLSGSLRDPQANIDISGTGLVLGDQKVPEFTAKARMRANVVTVEDLSARTNGGKLAATGSVDLDGPINLHVSGKEFALATFQPLLGAGKDLAGHLAVEATVTGTMQSPRAQAEITVTEAKVAGMQFERIEANAIRVGDGRIDLGRVEVVSQKASGFVSGTLPFRMQPLGIPTDQPIQLTASLPAHDLSYITAFTKAVESAAGQMVASLSITGTLAEPVMNGGVVVHGGRMKLASLEKALTDIEASLKLDGPWVIVETFRANSEQGGKLTASGRAALRAGADRSQKLDVRIVADRLQLGFRDFAGVHDLRFGGTASGEVALAGTLAQPALKGRLDVSQAQLNVPTEMAPRPAAAPLPFNPSLDLQVDIGPGSVVRRGRGLQAWVTGRVNVGGALQKPAIGGRVVVERGSLSYAGTSFQLRPGGTVAFDYDSPGPLNARLDVAALTRVRAASPQTGDRRQYEVTLRLTGAYPNPRVEVSSDPPDLPEYRLMAILSRTDQFEALARGNDMNNILKDQFMDILSGTVLPQVFEPIENGIANALGLDQINFDYGFDRPLRVDARKEILPRLYISYNRDMGGPPQIAQDQEGWSITYRVYQRLYMGWRRESTVGTASKDRLVLEGAFRF